VEIFTLFFDSETRSSSIDVSREFRIERRLLDLFKQGDGAKEVTRYRSLRKQVDEKKMLGNG
jgi:hypothetical protein